jgi:hypothetical protein
MTILILFGLCILLPTTWIALSYDNQIQNPSSQGYFNNCYVDCLLTPFMFSPWVAVCDPLLTFSLRVTWIGYYRFQPIPRMALEDIQGNYQYVPVVSKRLLKCKVFLSTLGSSAACGSCTLVIVIIVSGTRRDTMNLGMLLLFPAFSHLFVVASLLDNVIQMITIGN